MICHIRITESFGRLAFLPLVCVFALVSAVASTGATVAWKPGTQGDWFDPANWAGGTLPGQDDEVVIAGAGARVTLARPTPRLRSLAVRRGGTLVFAAGDASLTASEVMVRQGGTITAAGPFSRQPEESRVRIVCSGALTVEAGGSINVDAVGYAGGIGHTQDEDPASAGFGPGAGGYPKVWGASPGGSHGGRGGTPVAAAPYGSAEAPVEPGSGGGGGNGVGGGAGGGAIHLTAGTVVLHGGALTANGGNGVGTSYGGGGSGGSILITCDTFTGTGGAVAANGGHGSIYAGGGGGGRIAVTYRQVGDRGVVFSATGGANGYYFTAAGTTFPNFGEPGTLCFPQARAPGLVIPHTGCVLAPGAGVQTNLQDTVFYWLPWKVNPPVITVTKALYRTHPRPGAAATGGRSYVGPGLEMREVQGVEAQDDVQSEATARFSADNGRTWSDPVPLPGSSQRYGDVEVWEGAGPHLYDEAAGVLVDMWLRQIQVDGIYHCFTYYRLSRDFGRTWSEPRQLRYEEGAEFDPTNPLRSEFLLHNQAYVGSNIVRHSNGTLIHCVGPTNVREDPENDRRKSKLGSLCFIGRWDKQSQDYRWTPGQGVSISPEISSGGLVESVVAELRDGRVLVIWRGKETPQTAGHKWFSVSSDGGKTLSPVRELKYDDGSSFYSPSSFHLMIRHSVTKKLYWVGNITHLPPQGNWPRHPLVIAEVDERIPALRKDTVSVIDDIDETQPVNLQFSNFSLFENRETHDLELFLTTYGQTPERGPYDLTGDCYRYSVRLK